MAACIWPNVGLSEQWREYRNLRNLILTVAFLILARELGAVAFEKFFTIGSIWLTGLTHWEWLIFVRNRQGRKLEMSALWESDSYLHGTVRICTEQ
jgi:hypothetical protein